MKTVKSFFLRLLSFGIYPEMDENKKVAIRIASFDAIASVTAFFFCIIQTAQLKIYHLTVFHVFAFAVGLFGIYLIRRRYYDSGRILLHYIGLAGIFLSVDGLSSNSSYEFYYFAPLIVPFLTFTPQEVLKSIILSFSGLIVLILQLYLGNGLFSPISSLGMSDKIMTICMLFTYLIGLFSVSRWQINLAQEKLISQQKSMVHMNNIAALGVMSGGIAHEINNPLQILSTRLNSVRKLLKEEPGVQARVYVHLDAMEKTIFRIAKIVKGLKTLSSNAVQEIEDVFSVSDSIEDVLTICSHNIKDNEIELIISINTDSKARGQFIQFSQVLINLLNNSVDALEGRQEKWIAVEVNKVKETIFITITDSGPGIPEDIAKEMMNAFYTTKSAEKGTGLGLSISKTIIDKSGGRFYYDENCPNTRFVIELPVA